MTTTKKAWVNALFFVVTLVINALGALGYINGLSQKEISDMYVTLITPSPSTFSIWSVIYSLLILSVIMMILKKESPYYEHALDEISTLFRISSILNIVWIIAFSYVQVELSVLFILGFVVTLALLCLKLLEIDDGKRWLLPLTFGMYTGWLFIATVVNTAAMLVKLQWNGFGIANDVWAIIILIVAIVLVVGVLLRIKNAVFPLPIAWAYFGIYKFLAAPEGFKGQYGSLQNIALAGIVVLVVLAALQFYRNRFAILPKPQS